MNGFHHRCRPLVAAAVLLLGSCGQDAVHSPEAGMACDPCGSGADFASLLRGVQSTCGARLTCAAATFSLPGPGVCINASGDTTCQGTITDSGGTRHNQCTYTVTGSLSPVGNGLYAAYDVFCR
jgi:hypothetical protein